MFKKITLPFFISIAVVIITFLLFPGLESYFTNLLNSFGKQHAMYALLSFLVLMSDIILPVPSSVVMYVNGYVLGTFTGSAISLASLLVGATVGYYLGSLTSMGLKATNDDKANHMIAKYGAMAILITRGIPVLSESICVVCGYNKMPFKKYFLFNLIGYIPLCLLYACCGSVGYDKNTFLLSFGCSLLISACFWFLGKKYFIKPAA